jgi:hypothetical protein
VEIARECPIIQYEAIVEARMIIPAAWDLGLLNAFAVTKAFLFC